MTAGLTTPEQIEAFLAGAGTQAPTRTGVVITFTTDGPPFHLVEPDNPTWDSYRDDETRRTEIAAVLAGIGRAVESGLDSGPVRNSLGRDIGTFTIGRDD